MRIPHIPRLYKNEIKAFWDGIKSKRSFEKRCVVCGSSFISHTPHKFYCSTKCNPYEPRNKLGDKLDCKGCGDKYVKVHSNQSYCSYECKRESKKDRNTKQKRKLITDELGRGVCPFCSGKFYINHPNKRFCSSRCKTSMSHGLKSTKGLKGICKECGKEFIKGDGRQKFCSYSCGIDVRNKTWEYGRSL